MLAYGRPPVIGNIPGNVPLGHAKLAAAAKSSRHRVREVGGTRAPGVYSGQLAAQVGLMPVALPVPWKPNSVEAPAAILPL